MLSKLNRIGNKEVIEKLFRKGSLFKTKHLIFKFVSQNSGPSKFAVSVSKKVSKKAVKRNKMRRQIYEAIRLYLPKTDHHLHALIIVKKEMVNHKVSYNELEQDIISFFKSLRPHAE